MTLLQQRHRPRTQPLRNQRPRLRQTQLLCPQTEPDRSRIQGIAGFQLPGVLTVELNVRRTEMHVVIPDRQRRYAKFRCHALRQFERPLVQYELALETLGRGVADLAVQSRIQHCPRRNRRAHMPRSLQQTARRKIVQVQRRLPFRRR